MSSGRGFNSPHLHRVTTGLANLAGPVFYCDNRCGLWTARSIDAFSQARLTALKAACRMVKYIVPLDGREVRLIEWANAQYDPFRSWFESLDPVAAARVVVVLTRLEQGNFSNVKWFSGIGEVRIHWGPGLRVYIARVGRNTILLLGGGTKSTQRRDIRRAVSRWHEFRSHQSAKET